MTDTKLNTKEILELKARAHHLHPVVMVGQQGLTDAVIKETDAALTAHELIKVRVFGDDRAERIEICNTLCEAVDAQPVRHIGKLLVLWRKNIEPDSLKWLFCYCSFNGRHAVLRRGISACRNPFRRKRILITARCRLQVAAASV